MGAKKQEPQRRSGSGKEVLLNILSVEINGTEAISARENGSHRSTWAGACQQKASRATSPLTAPCWGMMASGEACGWAVVQMDYDEEMGPLRGMYGSMEAEFEVQRTIKRAELTAFLCLLRKVSGPIKVHVDNKGIIDGLRKGEKECVKPRAGDADFWINILGRIT